MPRVQCAAQAAQALKPKINVVSYARLTMRIADSKSMLWHLRTEKHCAQPFLIHSHGSKEAGSALLRELLQLTMCKFICAKGQVRVSPFEPLNIITVAVTYNGVPGRYTVQISDCAAQRNTKGQTLRSNMVVYACTAHQALMQSRDDLSAVQLLFINFDQVPLMFHSTGA